MSRKENRVRGQIRQAPESFLGQGEIAEINQHGLDRGVGVSCGKAY